MSKQIITVRLGIDLVAALDRVAHEHVITRTEVIETMLEDGLQRRNELIGKKPKQIKQDRIDGHWRPDDEV